MSDRRLHIDDRVLIAAVCNGDRMAFDCLFRRYDVDIVMFCSHFLSTREDCEDVAQSVFLSLWEQRADMSAVNGVKSWLLRSAQNACLNKLHHEAVVRRYSSEYLSILPYIIDDDASKPLLYSELIRLIAAAEKSLGENELVAWNMSRYQGMKYAEIAIALGISVRTVEDRIARAKNHFRKILNRHWAIILTLIIMN